MSSGKHPEGLFTKEELQILAGYAFVFIVFVAGGFGLAYVVNSDPNFMNSLVADLQINMEKFEQFLQKINCRIEDYECLPERLRKPQ